MTMDEPIVNKTTRYSVTDTSRILGIDRKTLAKYTAEGYIKAGYWKRTLRKFYSGAEITRFWRTSLL